MPRKPFWQAKSHALVHTPKPLELSLDARDPQSRITHTRAGKAVVRDLGFAENLSALYALWNAQRHELEQSSDPLPKRVEALGRLARVLPQLQVAERLYKAKRGDKAIEEMSEAELMAMLGNDTTAENK
jgi:hypothetical protein